MASVWSMTRCPPDFRSTLRDSARLMSSSTPYRSKIGAAPWYHTMRSAASGTNTWANCFTRRHSSALSMRTRSTSVPSRSRRMRIDKGRSPWTRVPGAALLACWLMARHKRTRNCRSVANAAGVTVSAAVRAIKPQSGACSARSVSSIAFMRARLGSSSIRVETPTVGSCGSSTR